jgi:hypothetical protein
MRLMVMLLMVIIVGAFAGPAAAAPLGPWLPSVATQLSDAASTSPLPQVAVAPDGTTTVAWVQAQLPHAVVQVRTRAAGVTDFGPVVALSDGSQDASEVQVATGPDGRVVVTWVESETTVRLRARTRLAGAIGFGEAQSIVEGAYSLHGFSAVFAAGLVTFAWTLDDGFPRSVSTRSEVVAGGTLGPTALLSSPGLDAVGPDLSAAADGTVVAVWSERDGGNVIATRTRPAGTTDFGPLLRLTTGSTTDNASDPAVALADNGTTTVVWNRSVGASSPYQVTVEARTRPAGAAEFGGVVELASFTGQTGDVQPRVAASVDGTTTVAWGVEDWLADTTSIVVVTRSVDGSFSPATTLAQSAGFDRVVAPGIAMLPDGGVTVVWGAVEASMALVRARTRVGVTGAFGETVLLGTGALAGKGSWWGGVQVGAAADGATTVVWQTFGDAGWSVRTRTAVPAYHALTVAKAGRGAGTVTSSPTGIDCGAVCTRSILDLTPVTVTAIPAKGSAFGGWSGACSGRGTTCVVTMTAAKSLTATFTRALSASRLRVEVRAESIVLRTRVTVPGAGRLALVATTKRNRETPRRWRCAASARTQRDSTVVLSCTLRRGAREQVRTGAMWISQRITFTPTGSSATVLRGSLAIARAPDL